MSSSSSSSFVFHRTVQAGRSGLVTKQRQHVSLIFMSSAFAIVGSTIDASPKLLGGESEERNGRAESHSGLIIFRRGGERGRTHIHIHTDIHCQPGDEVGPAVPACNPGNMELENIVANTVLLKAREGKT